MAGLACGEASPLAWRFLQPGVDAFLTIEDDLAVQAMRILADGSGEDPRVVAGESGATAPLLDWADQVLFQAMMFFDFGVNPPQTDLSVFLCET